MPEYSHPKGPLNLLSYLKDNSVKPDLGPKSYVAFGRCCPIACMSWRPCDITLASPSRIVRHTACVDNWAEFSRWHLQMCVPLPKIPA